MNDEHTAAYWLQKTMDAAHEAYDRLIDTVDFKNAIAEAEAIKQRMGICEKKKITNGDRIRQMTDEELAEWLDHVAGCGVCVLNEGKYRYSGDHCAHEYDCIQYIEKWLKQEVSEDAGSKTD